MFVPLLAATFFMGVDIQTFARGEILAQHPQRRFESVPLEVTRPLEKRLRKIPLSTEAVLDCVIYAESRLSGCRLLRTSHQIKGWPAVAIDIAQNVVRLNSPADDGKHVILGLTVVREGMVNPRFYQPAKP